MPDWVVAAEQVVIVVELLVFLAGYPLLIRPAPPVRRSPESWYLLASNGAFLVVMLLALVTLVLGRDWAGRDVVRQAAYALIVVVFGWQLGLLWVAVKARREG